MDEVLHLGDSVEIVTDRFEGQGAPRGSLGFIVDDWADGSNDVEVVDRETGDTIARIRAAADELRLHAAVEPTRRSRKHGILFGRGDDLGAPSGSPPSPGSPLAGYGGTESSLPWYGAETPPAGELEGDIPWELKDEPPSGPIFH